MSFNGIECVENKRRVYRNEGTACPPGTSYDPSTGVCRSEESQPIINGKNIERHLVPSEDVTCPSGYIYDMSMNKCRSRDFTNPITNNGAHPTIRCPSGYTYVPSLGKCHSISYINGITTYEAMAARKYSNGCPTGYTFVTLLRKCMRTSYVEPYRRSREVERPRYICPPGYDYMASINRCRRLTSVPPLSRHSGRIHQGNPFKSSNYNGNLVVNTGYELPWHRSDTNQENGQRRTLSNTH